MEMKDDELYKHMLEEHRFASEYRLKILAIWGAVYAAFAAAFSWVHHEAPSLSWVVTLLAGAATLMFWAGDRRHRPAIRRPKVIGEDIEKQEPALHEDKQFFAALESKTISHSDLIDYSALAMLVLLSVATGYLLSSDGKLPGPRATETQSCCSGINVSQTVVHGEQSPTPPSATKSEAHCQSPVHSPSKPDAPCKAEAK